jgi:phage-related minor tail protein
MMNMADKLSREVIKELSIKVNVDVSEALTGLKAIQREAKKATQALRELEAVISNQ